MSPEGESPTATKQPHRGCCPTPHNQRNRNRSRVKSSPEGGASVGRSPAEEGQAANAETARTWSLGWRTLAGAFHGPTQQWLEGLRDGAVTTALSEATRWLGSDRERFSDALGISNDFVAKQRSRNIEDVLRDISAEYDRLFIGGTGPMEAPPCESAYRERVAAGAVMARGARTSAVEEVYRRYGMQPPLSQRDLPDNIATELEFMCFLTQREAEAWEKGKVETAKELRRAQLRFVEDHLAHWLPDFCGRVQDATQSDLYFALAGIRREFLTVETRWACGKRVP